MTEEFIVTSPICYCDGKKLKKDLIDSILASGPNITVGGRRWSPGQSEISITKKKYTPRKNQTSYTYEIKLRMGTDMELLPKDLPDNIIEEVPKKVVAEAPAKKADAPKKVKEPEVIEAKKNEPKQALGVKIKSGRIVRQS